MKVTVCGSVVILSSLVIAAFCEIITFGNRRNWIEPTKPARQISTNESFTAQKAIDGNVANAFTAESCSQTLPAKNPWWIVELELYILVQEILIVNRGDCCGEDLHIFSITVHNEHGSVYMGLCHRNTKKVETGRALLIRCAPDLVGSDIKITLEGENAVLTLCEVMVAGRQASEVKFDKRNWSAGMPTSQSTTYAASTPAAAVDGNTNGNFAQGSCTQTKQIDKTPWWMVDLLQQFLVKQVNIFSRTDCCPTRNIIVDVINGTGDTSPVLCRHVKQKRAVPVKLEVYCNTPTQGSAVRIRKDMTGARNGALVLCEVQVVGHKIVTDPEYSKMRDNHVFRSSTYQSLDLEDYPSVWGVDTKVNNNNPLCHTCTRTTWGDEDFLWWKVVYDGFFVEAVAVALPIFCCEDDIDEAHMQVWLDDRALCGHIPTKGAQGVVKSVTCPMHFISFYTIIYKLPPDVYLELCEVEVYGNSETQNWALGKWAVIKDGPDKFPATFAVDGDISNGFQLASCVTYVAKHTPISLIVELKHTHIYVQRIHYITPVGSGARVTIRDPTIKLEDFVQPNFRICTPNHKDFPPGYNITVTCHTNVVFNVASVITLVNGPNEKELAICEVEIYGLFAFFE